MPVDLNELTDATRTGNRKTTKALTEQGLSEGLAPNVILDAMVMGMDQIGEKFKRNEVFVPEMLIAARAMKEGLAILEPELVKGGYEPIATVVIGTVQGDLHDIGKNLVGMMLKGANYQVIDLGTNVPAAKFIAAAQEHNAEIVGLSALLTTTMAAMKETVESFKKEGLCNVKVVIGGAPITQGFADEIGADAFAPDAASAVDTVRELLTA